MIIQIILLIFLTLLISLILFFLSCSFVPAVKKQTKISDSIIFSKIEHEFKKLVNDNPAPVNKSRAAVKCACRKSFAEKTELKAFPNQTCSLVTALYGSRNDCKYSCIGLGDCVKACPQEAIVISNKTAVITDLCNGCGRCIGACPKNIITMITENDRNSFTCNNKDEELTTCSEKGKDVNIEFPVKKSFKIWRYCYIIFMRRNR